MSAKASNWLYAKARSVRHRHRPRTIVIGIVSGLLSTIVLGFWLSGHLGDAYGVGVKYGENRLLAAGFGVDHIDIDGARHSSKSDVLKVMGIEKGELVFAVNLTDVRRRVESLGWVQKASVTRLLPNRISVVITERTPFAIWQNQNKFTLINAKGDLIRAASPAEYSDLPRIIGAGAEAEATKLLASIGTRKELVQKIRYVVRVSERRWNLIFFSGATMFLPASDWDQALDQLVASNDFIKMLELPDVIIDARVKQQFSVRKKPAKSPVVKRIVS